MILYLRSFLFLSCFYLLFNSFVGNNCLLSNYPLICISQYKLKFSLEVVELWFLPIYIRNFHILNMISLEDEVFIEVVNLKEVIRVDQAQSISVWLVPLYSRKLWAKICIEGRCPRSHREVTSCKEIGEDTLALLLVKEPVPRTHSV